jgi:hypothetical protein
VSGSTKPVKTWKLSLQSDQIDPYKLIFPPQCITHMEKGWTSHLGLNQLSHAKCAASVLDGRPEMELKWVAAEQQFKLAAPALDAKDEKNMKPVDFHEAYPSLIALVRRHFNYGGPESGAEDLADELYVHFKRLIDKPDFYERFSIYFAYDIGVRERLPYSEGTLHPAVWHQDLWDLVNLKESRRIQAEQELRIKNMESMVSRSSHPVPSTSKTRPFLPSSTSRASQSTAASTITPITNANGPRAKCIYCGKRTHGPRQCPDTDNGFLSRKSTADKIWKITATGLQVCFGFNGINACRVSVSCEFKHICSRCGSESHNAQSCPKE